MRKRKHIDDGVAAKKKDDNTVLLVVGNKLVETLTQTLKHAHTHTHTQVVQSTSSYCLDPSEVFEEYNRK